MPRQPQFPPRIYHHTPSGQDRVRVRGTDIYLGPHDSEVSRRAYARVCADLAAGRDPRPAVAPGGGLTVAQVVLRWWAEEGPRYSERGRERPMFRLALNPLMRLEGGTPAAALDAERLEGVRMAMATGSWLTAGEREKRGSRYPLGWCASVVNRRVVRIRTVWRWAERRRLVPAGSWAGLCALPGLAQNDARVRHSAPRKSATWGDTLSVARGCPAPVRTMLLLQWWSGMRSGEVRIMRPCDLDRSDPGVWLYRPSAHKNDWRGQARVVALGPKCRALLGPWLWEMKAPDAYLFPPSRARGAPCYSPFTYAQAVRRAAGRAGVTGFTPYSCRHSCKDRITAACGLDAARSAMGQRSISSTDGYGTRADVEAAARAARRLS
jgi:integrase